MGVIPSKIICDVCKKEVKPTGKLTAGITASTQMWMSWQRGGAEHRLSTQAKYCHPGKCERLLFEKLFRILRKKLKDASKFERKLKNIFGAELSGK